MRCSGLSVPSTISGGIRDFGTALATCRSCNQRLYDAREALDIGL
jgi:hypothetical protein